jgi:hypothetical protein
MEHVRRQRNQHSSRKPVMKVVINDSSAPELPSANDAVLLLSDVADYSLDIHLSENAFEPGPGSTPLSFGAGIRTAPTPAR